MHLALAQDEGKTVTYISSGGDWRRFGSRHKRPLDSVILDESLKESVMSDIQQFLNNSHWYKNMGIPYRRGYLFYGLSGTGKTSFIFALAGYFAMNICIVSLGDKELNDEQLNQLLNSAPRRSILLLEDIDAAYVNRNTDKSHRITFSGLLNALDGVAAQEGRLLFMSTNRYDVLDEALIRPGRVDFVCSFGAATTSQIRKMFERFYPSQDRTSVESFTERVPEDSITMAELQGYFLKYKDKPQQAIQMIEKFIHTLEPRKSIAAH